jgi:hypothetical protein
MNEEGRRKQADKRWWENKKGIRKNYTGGMGNKGKGSTKCIRELFMGKGINMFDPRDHRKFKWGLWSRGINMFYPRDPRRFKGGLRSKGINMFHPRDPRTCKWGLRYRGNKMFYPREPRMF